MLRIACTLVSDYIHRHSQIVRRLPRYYPVKNLDYFLYIHAITLQGLLTNISPQRATAFITISKFSRNYP